MNLLLAPGLEELVQNQVKRCRYSNANYVDREVFWLLEDRSGLLPPAASPDLPTGSKPKFLKPPMETMSTDGIFLIEESNMLIGCALEVPDKLGYIIHFKRPMEGVVI